jgi:trehalose/maltose transport system substrate-binding protein
MLAALASLTANAARVTLSCGSVGTEFELCKSGAQAWAAQTGNQVEVLSAPASSSDRLSQYQLLLAAGSSEIDVFVMDTTWPGMIGDFFIDLSPLIPAQELKRFFPAFIRNNTVQGKLAALPWFIDAGVLHYRRDLLEKYAKPVPKTWEELTSTAELIQDAERKAGQSKFWGFVFQGRAYEGLTCNALEWIASFGGGTIVNSGGEVTVDGPRARAALELASRWVGKISPPGVLNYMEEESRGVYQSGNALFLRNWPYVWKFANAPGSPLRGKTGMAPLPAATLGGWSLGISKYSRSRDAALSLVLYLTSPAEQKKRMLATGLNPTLPELYDDAELKRMNPALPTLKLTFDHAVPRPSQATRNRYNRVSTEVWESVHRILARQSQASEELPKLKARLLRIGRNGKW